MAREVVVATKPVARKRAASRVFSGSAGAFTWEEDEKIVSREKKGFKFLILFFRILEGNQKISPLYFVIFGFGRHFHSFS